MAGAGRMSPPPEQRLFQKARGTPIRARIREPRLLAAYEGLQRSAAIAEAAHDAGYVSPKIFATAFGRRFDTSPSQLRLR
ncbi:MAG TPA: helix-turn-helix domain-containing protein [Albidovulum sp.]|uniref:helix-turn-helix domain-containing protein n=1 Tax=Albidovulum sp. TaxID=1872424 RepID=UPI002CD6415F|nr:helix-turn-helix domain-containing protein [Albidovulum sp.]